MGKEAIVQVIVILVYGFLYIRDCFRIWGWDSWLLKKGKPEFSEKKNIIRCRKENQKQTGLKYSISSTMLVRSECPYYLPPLLQYMESYVALNKPDTVIYLLGTDGSIDYSILSLPVRYPFFLAYLAVLAYCLVSVLCWLTLNVLRILPTTVWCSLSRYLIPGLGHSN